MIPRCRHCGGRLFRGEPATDEHAVCAAVADPSLSRSEQIDAYEAKSSVGW